MGLMHCVVCLFTPAFTDSHFAWDRKGMARLS